MPYYLDPTSQEMKVMTLKGNMDALGPKVKEFRKNFTKYSLPPSLKKQLTSLLPPNYPKVSKFINPFGGDDYDSIIPTEEDINIPIVYLLEHTVALSRQDLADIWQGIMPDIAATMKTSVSAIDHYMPGTFSYDSVFGVIADNLPDEQKDFLQRKKAEYTKGLYVSDDLGVAGNTYNWPYDYCSLVEMGKLSINVGFRPELEREIEDISEEQETNARSRGERNKKVLENKQLEQTRVNAPRQLPPVGSGVAPQATTFIQPPPGAEIIGQPPGAPLPDDLPFPADIPEGMTPPVPGQQVDPFAGESPLQQEQFDPGKMNQGDIPAEFRNLTPAQMERRRTEEMAKRNEPQQNFTPSSAPPRRGGGGGGTSGGSGGGGGY
jgi:hypothetical protein